MNKVKVKELKRFVDVMFPKKVGDKSFFRLVKRTYKGANGFNNRDK